MANTLLLIFLAINLLIRVPIRIAIKSNPDNKKLFILDFILLLVVAVNFIACIVCALIEGEVDPELAITCIIVFGGLFLLLFIPFVIVTIKDFKEKTNKTKKEKPINNSKKTQVENFTSPHIVIPTDNFPTVHYCRICGNKLMPDSAFCDKCGTKIVS